MGIGEELAGILADIEDGAYKAMTKNELYVLLTSAAGCIDRLERANQSLRRDIRDLRLDLEDLQEQGNF